MKLELSLITMLYRELAIILEYLITVANRQGVSDTEYVRLRAQLMNIQQTIKTLEDIETLQT